MRLPTSWIAIAIALVGAVVSEDEGKPTGQLPPEVGEPAPVFRLNDHDGDATRVGGEADHWTILAFYPMAMTPG